eukprot:TRINITY_DN28942_c0_g1_i1.p1 TRINITY_DN28942_c0_g1~~TRINITY_DN28942_c0_g1_i1.p1  ORF type:complete len:552 (+),score=120.28 TRINITY_DN28942_c0_g1_i1:48-1703(+)
MWTSAAASSRRLTPRLLRLRRQQQQRGVFHVVDSIVKSALTSPAAGSALGGAPSDRLHRYEEQKAYLASHGVTAVEDVLNETFKALSINLRVAPPGTSRLDDLSESGLKKRLEALNCEQKLVERYLNEGLTACREFPSAPPTPSSSSTSAVQPEATATASCGEHGMSASVGDAPMMKTGVMEADVGEEYFEADALSRRLKKWWVEDSVTEIPYEMMSSFELYPQWMPWCQQGTVLASHPARGVTKAAVGFGINIPLMGTLGDTVEYVVELDPPSTSHCHSRVYTINEGSRYCDRLVYDWRFQPLEGGRTKVILEVEFKASAAWCLPIWEAIRRDIINGVANSFSHRVRDLQASRGGDQGRPAFRPKMEKLTAVLQGPFLRDEAIVITESNGRTIRHANEGFKKLVGVDGDLRGIDIPDLLQNFQTDRNVLRGISSAVKNRLPATATVVNQNRAGEHFLNRLVLAPLDDDEQDSGVAFWAILKIVEKGGEQALELSQPGEMDAVWGPDYQHPDAITGKEILEDITTKPSAASTTPFIPHVETGRSAFSSASA